MATIEICDICGSSKDVKRIYYCYGRETDGAGSMSDVGDTFDLCPKHQIQVLEATLIMLWEKHKIHKHERNKIQIEIIKRRIEHANNTKD